MPAGRPLKFKTVKELQDKINAYFADCDPHPEQVVYFEWHEIEVESTDNKGEVASRKVRDQTRPPKEIVMWDISKQKHYTITGLAMALNTTRETLLDYENKDEYSDTIKKAKSKIENYVENNLFGSNVTGPIFNLKNNYGWRDKTEQDLHVKELPKPLLGGNSVPTNDIDSKTTKA